MSLSARKELLERIRSKYQEASWNGKNQILTAFVQATGYRRKYAISLLNSSQKNQDAKTQAIRQRRKVYDDEVQQAFLTVWNAANQICPKRLMPFLPQFVESLEKHGHLSLPECDFDLYFADFFDHYLAKIRSLFGNWRSTELLSNHIQWRQVARILMTDVRPIFSFRAIAALVIPSA